MARNMDKIINETEINPYYDLTCSDIQNIINRYKPFLNDHIYDVVADAFRYGYAMGTRATKNKRK